MKVTVTGSKRFFLLTNLDFDPEEFEEPENELPETIQMKEEKQETTAEEQKLKLQKFMFGIEPKIGKGSFEAKSKRFLTECQSWINAGDSSIVKYNPTTKKYCFSAVSGSAEDSLVGETFSASTGIMGFCIQKNLSLHVRNVENDERFAKNIADNVGVPVKDLFCVPITNGHRVIGAAEFLNSKSESGFEDVEIEMIKYAVRFLS